MANDGRHRLHRRRWRAAATVLVAAACAGLGLAVPASAGTTPTATATPGAGATPSARPLARVNVPAQRAQVSTTTGGTRYARIVPACAAPKPGHAACLALRRVDVAKGAKGAVAYTTLVGAHGPKGGYSPADLAKVYRLDPTKASNQVIALVDAYDNPRVRQELNVFDKQYGLPVETADSFRVVNQDGGTELPQTDWGWATETALDVQAVRGICNTCKILLVEAKNASGASLAKAVDTAVALGATIVSNSYGAPEQGMTGSAQEEQLAYRHHGVVIVAATGDDGWYDWDFVNDYPTPDASDSMPNAPASLPSVVAVGGTTLTLNADGTRASETVWNSNGPSDSGADTANGASGGGCSQQFKAPSWQRSVAGYAKTGCGSKRMAGDVAALADPRTGYSVYAPTTDGSHDEWQVIGGTSLAAPLVAGMYGLVGGAGGIDYPTQSLYLNYKYNPSWAYDVRTGGNGFCGGDTTANCSQTVTELTSGSPGGSTGNPNNLATSDGDWLGLLDCGYAYDGSEATLPNNTQCNAAIGYDGPSGVGTPNGVRILHSAFPSVQIAKPTRPRAKVKQYYRATRFVDTIATATQFAWHWHDGSKPTVTTKTSIRHRFSKPGAHVVQLTAWDSLHRRVTVQTTVRVR